MTALDLMRRPLARPLFAHPLGAHCGAIGLSQGTESETDDALPPSGDFGPQDRYLGTAIGRMPTAPAARHGSRPPSAVSRRPGWCAGGRRWGQPTTLRLKHSSTVAR